MSAAATHTDLSRMKPVGFLKNPSELLEKEKKLMLEIWDASGMNDDEFSQTVVPAVQNLAEYVELLPASAQHHHSEEGGLFKHSLETALFCLRLARTSILARYGTHAEVNFSKNYWSHAAFLGGLFHDLGKVVSSFAVFDEKTHKRWKATEESLWEWGTKNNVERYVVIALQSTKDEELNDPFGSSAAKNAVRAKHRGGDPHEEFTAALADKLIPPAYRKWLLTVENPNLLEEIQRALTKDSIETSLKKCIQEADGASTKRNVFQNIAYPVCESSTSVVSAFLNGIAFALSKGFWKINKVNAEVFVIEGKCFIDWNRVALSSLCAFLESNGKKVGFIQRKDELSQWLLDNGLIYGNPKYTPKGDYFESPFFTVMPKCAAMPTRAVWLTHPPFTGLVSSIEGFVYDCTDVAPVDADDPLFTSASRGAKAEGRAEEIFRTAEEIERARAEKIQNEKYGRNPLEKLTEEKLERTKEIKRDRDARVTKVFSEYHGKGFFGAAKNLVDRVLKEFGYSRFYDAEVREVQVPEKIEREKDLTPVKRQPQAQKSTSSENKEEVIIQGFEPDKNQKALPLYRTLLQYHPELDTTDPMFNEEERGWKTYRNFPHVPLFVESEFCEEEEEEEPTVFPETDSEENGADMSDWSWDDYKPGEDSSAGVPGENASTDLGNGAGPAAKNFPKNRVKRKKINPLDKSPSFSDFADKTTTRFLWRYYPFAQRLSVCGSPHTLKKLKFKPEQEKDRVWLWSFASQGNIPSEIFPRKIFKKKDPKKEKSPGLDVDPRSVPGESGNTSSVGQADLPGRTPAFSEASGVSPSATGLPGEIQFAPFETDSALVVYFAKFYEKALRAYRIGVDRGCFPKEFKDSEFYPLFIELATLFTNRAECVAGEVSEILPLVEVNATTVRVNAWVLFCGRFRSVYRNPETDEEDPANLLTKRVEKFLKPFVQVHPNSFLSRFRGEDGRETEEPFSSDYSVVFTDALTVNAVNFLVRAVDMPSADVQLYFKNLYDATHENEADEKFRSDQNFGFRNARTSEEVNPMETGVETPTQNSPGVPGQPGGEENANGQTRSGSESNGDSPGQNAENPEGNIGEGQTNGESPSAEGSQMSGKPSDAAENGNTSADKGASGESSVGNGESNSDTPLGGSGETGDSVDSNNNKKEINDSTGRNGRVDEETGEIFPDASDDECPWDESGSGASDAGERDDEARFEESVAGGTGSASSNTDDNLRFLYQIKEELTGGGGAFIQCDEISYEQDSSGVICSISKEKWKSLLAAQKLKAHETGELLSTVSLFFRKNRIAARMNSKEK